MAEVSKEVWTWLYKRRDSANFRFTIEILYPSGIAMAITSSNRDKAQS